MDTMNTQRAQAAQAADLTPDERRNALKHLATRREELQRELLEIDAIEHGHRQALHECGEPTGSSTH